jgi:hypothetical protein
MNIQIAELAAQALDYTEEQSKTIDVNSITMEEGSDWWDNTYNEKFAELIVQECALFIENKFDFRGDEIYAAEELKKYFGVKE